MCCSYVVFGSSVLNSKLVRKQRNVPWRVLSYDSWLFLNTEDTERWPVGHFITPSPLKIAPFPFPYQGISIIQLSRRSLAYLLNTSSRFNQYIHRESLKRSGSRPKIIWGRVLRVTTKQEFNSCDKLFLLFFWNGSNQGWLLQKVMRIRCRY